ncbi:MAG: hypothetical protein N2C14_18895, partial [Planctomycetales bacterium]
LHDDPANVFVADFLGGPGMNVFPAKIGQRDDGGGLCLRWGRDRIPIPPESIKRYPDLPRRQGEELFAGLRPEAFRSPDQVPESNRITVEAVAVERLGHETLVYFDQTVESLGTDSAAVLKDAEISPARTVARLAGDAMAPEPGENFTIGVDLAKLRLFDSRGQRLGAS